MKDAVDTVDISSSDKASKFDLSCKVFRRDWILDEGLWVAEYTRDTLLYQ